MFILFFLKIAAIRIVVTFLLRHVDRPVPLPIHAVLRVPARVQGAVVVVECVGVSGSEWWR